MNKTWIVAKETYIRAVKNWAFLLLVFGPIILMLISGGVGYFGARNFDTPTTKKIGIVVKDQGMQQAFGKKYKYYSNQARAKKATKTDKIKGYLLVDAQKSNISAEYYSDENLDTTEKQEIVGKLQALQQAKNVSRAKLTSKQLQLLAQSPVFKEKIDTHQKNVDDTKKIGKKMAFYGLVFILYMIVLTYSQIIATEIAKEKGTKIMEMIFSSMPGKNYFDGKILGIAGELLTHILVYVVLGFGSFVAIKQLPELNDLLQSSKPIIDEFIGNVWSWSLAFIIVDVILFVVYAAICGAIVTKVEDANKAIGPLTTIVIAGFMIGLMLGDQPNNPIVVVSSYLPFISSFTMPLRIINGEIATWKIMISLIILLAFTIISFIEIRKYYPRLVLQTDDLSLFKTIKRAIQSRD